MSLAWFALGASEGSIDVRRAATVANDRGATQTDLKGTRRAREKAARAADMVSNLRVECREW